MASTDFEDKYLDVLHNIEFAIVGTFHAHPELVDFDVETVINALIQRYNAEQSKRTVAASNLNPLRQGLLESVEDICEWHLARKQIFQVQEGAEIPLPTARTLEEIIACLKRIRKSVQTWNKRGGRRGYLTFAQQYVK